MCDYASTLKFLLGFVGCMIPFRTIFHAPKKLMAVQAIMKSRVKISCSMKEKKKKVKRVSGAIEVIRDLLEG